MTAVSSAVRVDLAFSFFNVALYESVKATRMSFFVYPTIKPTG